MPVQFPYVCCTVSSGPHLLAASQWVKTQSTICGELCGFGLHGWNCRANLHTVAPYRLWYAGISICAPPLVSSRLLYKLEPACHSVCNLNMLLVPVSSSQSCLHAYVKVSVEVLVSGRTPDSIAFDYHDTPSSLRPVCSALSQETLHDLLHCMSACLLAVFALVCWCRFSSTRHLLSPQTLTVRTWQMLP